MNLAKLASPLNWRHRNNDRLPQFFLLTDVHRLADPSEVLARMPRGGAVILRHPDRIELARLARRVIPRAHRFGLKVLLAGDARLAIRLGADGAHLSEAQARRGPLRLAKAKPDFLITAAAHSRRALWRATRAGADLSLLSPVFASVSHPGAHSLGVLRFLGVAQSSPVPVVALGGITHKNARRLRADGVWGLAAIGAWRD